MVVPYDGSQLYDYSAVVSGDYLYIDGGFIRTGSSGTYDIPASNYTLSVSLAASFPGTAVPARSIPKPDAFHSSKGYLPALWSTGDNTFFSWGSHALNENTVQNRVWEFSADGKGSGTWKYSGTSSPTAQIASIATAAMKDVVYMMGSLPNGPLAAFGWKTGAWTYIDLPASVTRWGSNMVALPDFGPEGTLLFLGGDKKGNFFGNVSLFDPAEQKWYMQTATGEMPNQRGYFGIAGVRSVEDTFEVLIHAGANNTFDVPNRLWDSYVLSLPAFRWFKLSGEYEHRNQAGVTVCEPVGGGQIMLLDVFPWDGKPTSDPDTFGIPESPQAGFVDLTTLSYPSGYEVDSGDYKLSSDISKYYESLDPNIIKWDAPEVKELFTGKASLTPRFWTTEDTTANQTSSTGNGGSSDTTDSTNDGPSTGAIAGGVVGAIAFLAIVGVLAFLWWRRRRRTSTAATGSTDEKHLELPASTARALEIDGSDAKYGVRMELDPAVCRTELDATQHAEMEGTIAVYELDGEGQLKPGSPDPASRRGSDAEIQR